MFRETLICYCPPNATWYCLQGCFCKSNYVEVSNFFTVFCDFLIVTISPKLIKRIIEFEVFIIQNSLSEGTLVATFSRNSIKNVASMSIYCSPTFSGNTTNLSISLSGFFTSWMGHKKRSLINEMSTAHLQNLHGTITYWNIWLFVGRTSSAI